MQSNKLEFNRRQIPIFKENLVSIETETIETLIKWVWNKTSHTDIKNLILGMQSIKVYQNKQKTFIKVFNQDGHFITLKA